MAKKIEFDARPELIAGEQWFRGLVKIDGVVVSHTKGVEKTAAAAARHAERECEEATAKAKSRMSAEAERIREGSDNPAAIQTKMDRVANERSTAEIDRIAAKRFGK